MKRNIRAKYGDVVSRTRLCAMYLVPWQMTAKSAVLSFKASFVALVLGFDGLGGTGSAYDVGKGSPCGGVVGSSFLSVGEFLIIFIAAVPGIRDRSCQRSALRSKARWWVCNDVQRRPLFANNPFFA